MTKPLVLLVDDDEDFLLVVDRALRRETIDAEIQLMRSSTEAVRFLGLADGPAPPRNLVALFLDLSMPEVSGWDLLARIRANPRLKDLPVVVVSSSSRPEDVRRSYDLGANSYVVKRYDPTGPGRYVTNAMRYWAEVNRAPQPAIGSSR